VSWNQSSLRAGRFSGGRRAVDSGFRRGKSRRREWRQGPIGKPAVSCGNDHAKGYQESFGLVLNRPGTKELGILGPKVFESKAWIGRVIAGDCPAGELNSPKTTLKRSIV
jgi:hypothetical protein